ncbi:MAG: hypothetical protein AAF996_16750 [Pseudomonadota bacterium]
MIKQFLTILLIAALCGNYARAEDQVGEFYQFTPYYAKDLIYSDPEFDVYSTNFPAQESEKFCQEVKGWEGVNTINSIVVLKKQSEYVVTKDWLWHTFRQKIIENVVNPFCPGTINFQATFFIEGVGFRADSEVFKKYERIYPIIFDADEAKLPRLEYAGATIAEWYFQTKNSSGENDLISASEIFYPQGFMVNNFYISENFPGGLDGELAKILLWRGKNNTSYDTFEITRWSNSKVASYSFVQKIASLKRSVSRAMRD